jgi:CheY-like chemotaxis protein/HPt (histidine-containing phosphotransfer) domain-containing protein
MAVTDDPARPVLVIDDTPINLTVVSRQLARLGLSHETTSDPLKGLELAKSGAYGALLVDVVMPDISGPDFAREVRAWEKRPGADGRRVPIIAVTGLAADDRQRCLAAGMDDFLTKPIAFQELQDTLERWLGNASASPSGVAAAPIRMPAEPAPIDVPKLGTILGIDDEAEISSIIALFCDNFASLAKQLERAVSAQDREATHRAAHAAKGAASTAAAVPLSHILQTIEESSLSADWTAIAGQVRRVGPEFERVLSFRRDRGA